MSTFIVIFIVIALALALVVKYDLIPDFDNILNKFQNKKKSSENLPSYSSAPINSAKQIQIDGPKQIVKINLDIGDSLTQADIELRETLFNKHIRHHQTFEGPNGEIKANIPFQAVIFLTRQYNPLVNEFGEIVVSVKKDTDKLILSDIIDGSPVNTLVNAPDMIIKQDVKNDSVSFPVEKEPITVKEITPEPKSSILDSFNLDDLLSEDEEEMVPDESMFVESNDEYENPFGEDTPIFEEEKITSEANATSKSIAEESINNNLTKISKDIIEADSVISGNIDFYDIIEIVNDDSSVQKAIINNLFIDNKIGFFEDKTILVPLETIARAISIAISNKNQYQIISEKQLKNNKNTSTLESLFAFILNNDNYIVEPKKHNQFKTFNVKTEEGKECKIFGVKLAPNFIKDFLPDMFNSLMKHPPKIISHTTNSVENFCD